MGAILELPPRLKAVLIWRVLYPLGFRGLPTRLAFTRIYRRGAWNGQESASGPGSGIARTAAIRAEISRLITQLHVSTMIDAACGDFHWMKEVDLSEIFYIGVDVVEELIAANQRRYGNPRRVFRTLDVSKGKLPAADLILCRDCLVHLPLQRALATLRNFQRSGSRHLLATTFTATGENKDMLTGYWRPLNLTQHPFNLPEPLLLINEQCPAESGRYADKCLGLWRLDQLWL